MPKDQEPIETTQPVGEPEAMPVLSNESQEAILETNLVPVQPIEPTPEVENLVNGFTTDSLVHQKDSRTLAHKWHGNVVKVEGNTVFVNWQEFKFDQPIEYEADQLLAYS